MREGERRPRAADFPGCAGRRRLAETDLGPAETGGADGRRSGKTGGAEGRRDARKGGGTPKAREAAPMELFRL